MHRDLIVVGDRTTHGGTVVSGDLTCEFDGKPLARVGDMTVCPRCKGSFAITTGAEDMRDGAGNGYARHGDLTACGAKLIASQINLFWDAEPSSGDPAAAEKAEALAAASQVAAPVSSGVCLDCLLQAATLGSSTVVRE